jgi:hypothetical protein
LVAEVEYLRNGGFCCHPVIDLDVVILSGASSSLKTNSFPTERQSVVIQVVYVVHVTTTTVIFTLKEIVNIRSTEAPNTCFITGIEG